MMLVGAGLIVASGAIASARADNDKLSTSLFTPRDRGDHFVCAAVNVGDKALRSITFKIRGSDGALLTPAVGSTNTNPTAIFNVTSRHSSRNRHQFSSARRWVLRSCRVRDRQP
jgi:hypothetical protein